MLIIAALTTAQFPGWAAQHCRDRLCHDESEMQHLFDRIIQHSLSVQERGWMIAFARVQPDYFDDEVEVVGWASLTEWKVGDEVRLQVQGFVDEKHRGKGIAGAMVVALCHDMPMHPLPVAVFSPEFFSIAKRLGWNATQYKHVDDGWISVGTTTAEGRSGGRGSDSGRVHADAPTVCGLPLAREQTGEAT
jgi:GNAT superfamily N-acetyltransferase